MQNKLPTLSICIPTFNSSKYLSETLDSIVAQFINKDIFNKTEIIISDNDSPDNTFEVVKKYQEKYSNIHYFKNETNLGGAVNVIKVTENANGEYLWLLTDNDCSTNSTLEYFFKILDETTFDVLIGNFGISDEEKIKNFHEDYMGYNKFNNIIEFGDFYGNKKEINLHTFGSNFSLYSIFFVKKTYFYESRNKLNNSKLKNHFFPHSLIIFSNIEKKVIIKPKNIFTLAMGHPSSWRHSGKLYSDFKEVFTSFSNSKKLPIKFKFKIKEFLFRYYLINFTALSLDKVPFIRDKLKILIHKNSILKKIAEYILNPSI